MGRHRFPPGQGGTDISPNTPARGWDGKAGIDLALLVSVCTIATVAIIHFQVAERFVGADRIHSVNLDALAAVAILLPAATIIYALRRHRDAMRVRAELAQTTLRDGLTGLPNRIYLNEWLEQELAATRRGNERIALLLVDLDRFKVVNDTHGHEVGDAMLVGLAGRLQRCAEGGSDRVVRYSGDEFVIVCHDDPLRPTATIRLARRIMSALEEPFAVGSERLRLTASIGVAVSSGGDDAEGLLRQADAARFHAKANGDGRPVVFDEAVHAGQNTPAALEPYLRRAAQHGDFRLVYQPVVDTDSGRMVSVEALLRWDHPEQGPISPAEFIPALEDTGLIVPVGIWILEEAVRQAHAWSVAFPDSPPLRVAINVSARQLAQSGFEDKVKAVLRKYPVAPGSICLEITEGALMVDIEAAWSALRLLKRMGIKLALDDFGTGYSSLSYIRRFSLDMLKIDRSFVKGLGTSDEDTAIVEHVIGMAQALGMVTVGEGVETPQQMSELQRLGCELAQGFLLGRPVPPEEIAAILESGGQLSEPRNCSSTADSKVPTELAMRRHDRVGARPFDAFDLPPAPESVGPEAISAV